jgi:hypothetical protein
MFEMLPGYHTQNFVSEVYRLREAAGDGGRGEDDGFEWAQAHVPEGEKRRTKYEGVVDG